MNPPERRFVIARTVLATPQAAFDAWTQPELLGWFLNPEQPVPPAPITVDLRVGGSFRVPMVVDETLRYTTGGIYLDIQQGERIRFAWGATDGWPSIEEGGVDEVPHALVELEEHHGRTRMTFTLTLGDAIVDEAAYGWEELDIRDGWTATIARFAA